jgi:adenosine deaminase
MRDWTHMPKVELHLHLEGAIPVGTLWELIQLHGGDAAVATRPQLEERFRYRDFDHFIETWVWMNGYLRTYEDFVCAAEAVARDLARQNIVYAEASFSPSDFRRHGLIPQELALAIRSGLDRVTGTEVALIVDLVRDRGPAGARETLEAILEVAEEAGVIGIGIGGTEFEYPPELFVDAYRTARAAGLHTTAHAGEGAGPESVWGAIRKLEVERVGHGIRAVEDIALVEHLVESRLHLEVCPTSNVRTGVATGWESHPARTLIDAGAVVTLNTDDPTLFGCSLAGEYRVLQEEFRLGEGAIRRISHNALEACWAPESTKKELRDQLAAWWGSGTGSGPVK